MVPNPRRINDSTSHHIPINKIRQLRVFRPGNRLYAHLAAAAHAYIAMTQNAAALNATTANATPANATPANAAPANAATANATVANSAAANSTANDAPVNAAQQVDSNLRVLPAQAVAGLDNNDDAIVPTRRRRLAITTLPAMPPAPTPLPTKTVSKIANDEKNQDQQQNDDQQSIEYVGPFALSQCTLATLAAEPYETKWCWDSRDSTLPYRSIKRLSTAEYDKMCALLRRLASGRHLFSMHSDNALMVYADLRERVLSSAVELQQDSFGRWYIIEPSIEPYGDLHMLMLEKKTLPEPNAQHIFQQLCAILAFCHTIGLVVCDLKLRKLVFTNQYRTSIRLTSPLDYHVCESPNDDTLFTRYGCPAYVSPEIVSLDKNSYAGYASDMWSAGVLLYVMLVGRYPFYDATTPKLFEKICTVSFVLPANSCSIAARIIIYSLFLLEPSARPTAQRLLQSSWFQRGTIARELGYFPPPSNLMITPTASPPPPN